MSPEEYTRLTEIEEDYFLLLEASRRLENNGDNETISFDTVMSDLGMGNKSGMNLTNLMKIKFRDLGIRETVVEGLL